MKQPYSLGTLAVKGGYAPKTGEGISPPIDLSSTYVHPGDYKSGVPTYARADSPAPRELEQAIADIEDGTFGVVFNAGTAGMQALLGELPIGSAVVMPDDVYFGFRSFAEGPLKARGVEARLVDMTDPEAIEGALPGASMVWTETPTNPHLRIIDLEHVNDRCRSLGIPWVCDNTFASPVLQRPLEHGAAASLESVTKYIGGHSDLILGSVATNDAELHGRLVAYRGQHGTQPDAFSCWLARRGLQTVALRVRHQTAAAQEIAERLAAHPKVTAVYYPGLPDHPGHEVAKRQMPDGFGGMLSFVVRGGADAANAVTDRCEVFTAATSLGSVESLIERRARWTGEQADPGLLRISVGIEDPADLWRDLDQALAAT